MSLSSLDVNNGNYLTECFVDIELVLVCLACNEYLKVLVITVVCNVSDNSCSVNIISGIAWLFSLV